MLPPRGNVRTLIMPIEALKLMLAIQDFACSIVRTLIMPIEALKRRAGGLLSLRMKGPYVDHAD